jgi:alkanesulfonate monooxygenase SsuD/methylene tetrahydromethanopterin reductase-like flavin-dependent oxidoreductase (luciferase family)
VVTGYLNSAAKGIGLARQPEHDTRYEIAEEYMQIVYKLWEGSWEPNRRKTGSLETLLEGDGFEPSVPRERSLLLPRSELARRNPHVEFRLPGSGGQFNARSAASDQNRSQITPSAGPLSTLRNQWIRNRIAA